MKIHAIEKNVPFRRSEATYPFHKMEVGDSFQVDGDEKDAKTLRSAASMYAARKNTKFSVKRSGDGYRVWRVA